MSANLHKTAQYLCSPPLSERFAPDEIDTEAILSYEAVVAQQDYICGEIGAPTTIIQFRSTESGEWERIDSRVASISLRTSCDLLRRCVPNEGALCRGCDAQHAQLFYKMGKAELAAGELERRIEEIRKQWDETYPNPHHKPIAVYRGTRTFLSYNCPMLGYRELVFPIFFEETSVAVFVIGQIKLEGKETVILSSKKNFFAMNEDIFDEYLDRCQASEYAIANPIKYTREAIKEYIIEQGIRGTQPEYPEMFHMKAGLQIPVVEDQISLVKYDNMIETVCKWLSDLEKLLDEEMRRKRENYTRRILADAMSDFHIASADVAPTFSMQKSLWNPVRAFAHKLSKQCALEYMIIYGAQSIYEKKIPFLKVVASYGIDNYTIETSSFSFEDVLTDTIMCSPSDNKSAPELFSALSWPLCEDCSCKSVVFQPMKEIPAASVAILIKYTSDVLKTSIEDVLIAGIFNLTALISSRLAVQFENIVQLQLEKTLRLYKHELVNLSQDVSRAVAYLDYRKMRKTSSAKLEVVHQDANSTLGMFDFMSKNIDMLVNNIPPNKPIPPEKKNVWAYQDLLYKWENIKRFEAVEKSCDFVFQKSFVKIGTDPRYAELVVYNLLTNAVKYAYDGTKIYFHCEKQPSSDKYMLSVTNFAFLIPEEERDHIFSIGYRAQEARQYYPEGSGIGLWISHEAMVLLGGTVKLCEPKFISSYNVPLLYAYMKHPDKYKKLHTSETFQEAKVEYDRLLNHYIINDFGERQSIVSWVISERHWTNPRRSKMRDDLHKETYQIRFEVYF